MCIKTLVGHVMRLKRLITVPFESSGPFHLLRLMGVLVPSLHIESTDLLFLYQTASYSHVARVPLTNKIFP